MRQVKRLYRIFLLDEKVFFIENRPFLQKYGKKPFLPVTEDSSVTFSLFPTPERCDNIIISKDVMLLFILT